MGDIKNVTCKIQAILAAALFGASTPMAKLLLGEIDPVLLAALLYLGCGFGVLALKVVQNCMGRRTSAEARLSAKDMPWLAGATIAGGVLAPMVLLISLQSTPAATASLLLNLEGVATSLIAVRFFNETLGKKVWAAVGLITVASAILTWDQSGNLGFSVSAVGIVLACVLWGADNNFTKNISAKDPLIIVAVKGVAAGTVSLAIALTTGGNLPTAGVVFGSLVLGFFSYGISIMLFIYAMRGLGAARASAFFALAPFMGALISLILFWERPNLNYILSLPVMIIGVILIFLEKREYRHQP